MWHKASPMKQTQCKHLPVHEPHLLHQCDMRALWQVKALGEHCMAERQVQAEVGRMRCLQRGILLAVLVVVNATHAISTLGKILWCKYRHVLLDTWSATQDAIAAWIQT